MSLFFMFRRLSFFLFFFFNDTATTEIYTLSLHDALPIYTASTTRTSRTTRAPRGRVKASSATWTNSFVQERRTPCLRDCPADRRGAPRRHRRRVSDPCERGASPEKPAAVIARLAASAPARESIHRRLARAVRPRRAGAHRRVFSRRRADRRRSQHQPGARRREALCGFLRLGVHVPGDPAHDPLPRGALAARAGAPRRVRLGTRRAFRPADRQGALFLAEGGAALLPGKRASGT